MAFGAVFQFAYPLKIHSGLVNKTFILKPRQVAPFEADPTRANFTNDSDKHPLSHGKPNFLVVETTEEAS